VTLNLPRDCPECGAMASVRDGVCDLCLTDLDEFAPAARARRSTPPAVERRRELETDEELWFSEAWFS
jgi:hypothetical protein